MMTPHNKRPIVPELRDVPLTWCKCGYVKERQNSSENDCAFDRLSMMDTRHCFEIVKDGDCPRGFAA